MLYVPHESSFISTQFFVFNLDDWLGVSPTYLLFFGTPSSYYHVNLRSSTIFRLFYEDIYLTFGITVSLSTVPELFCDEVSWIALIEAVLSSSVVDYLAWSRGKVIYNLQSLAV